MNTQKWIAALMESMDAHLDGETRARVLEACGRTCIPRGLVAKAQQCNKGAADVGEFLDRLQATWRHLYREGGDVYVVYDECYCPLVKKYAGQLSPTFCNCSRGWVKELFESALERPVEVLLQQSVLQGDPECRFLVRL